jgi:hypothetical protein
MKYDFLKNFPERMKRVGLYALLMTHATGESPALSPASVAIHDDGDVLRYALHVQLFFVAHSLYLTRCGLSFSVLIAVGTNR